MGMLRTTIILGAIILALPTPPEDPAETAARGPSPSTLGYVTAAAEAFSDVRDFCGRRPFVCETAGQIAGTMERKAKYSAKLIYEWANEATEDSAKAPLPDNIALADKIKTGSVSAEPLPAQSFALDLFLLPPDAAANSLRSDVI